MLNILEKLDIRCSSEWLVNMQPVFETKILTSCSRPPLKTLNQTNSLPINKFVECSNLTAFAVAKINVTEKLKFVVGWVEYLTSWENEKMLVTSIFSLPHNIFKRLLFKHH